MSSGNPSQPTKPGDEMYVAPPRGLPSKIQLVEPMAIEVGVGSPGHISTTQAQFNRMEPEPIFRRQTLPRTKSAKSVHSAHSQGAQNRGLLAQTDLSKPDCWRVFSWMVTCCCPGFLLAKAGHMDKPNVQQAWREKVALCVICFLMCCALAFLIFGFTSVVCQQEPWAKNVGNFTRQQIVQQNGNRVSVHGWVYEMTPDLIARHKTLYGVDISSYGSQDVSDMFPPDSSVCNGVFKTSTSAGKAVLCSFSAAFCHSQDDYNQLGANLVAPLQYPWGDIANVTDTQKLMVLGDMVVDVNAYLTVANSSPFLGAWADAAIKAHIGRDASIAFQGSNMNVAQCLVGMYGIGVLQNESLRCFISDVVLNVSLVVILAVVFVRFFLSVYFQWFISQRLGMMKENREFHKKLAEKKRLANGVGEAVMRASKPSSRRASRSSISSQGHPSEASSGEQDGRSSRTAFDGTDPAVKRESVTMFDQSRRLSIRASTFSSPGSGPTLKSPVTNNIESEFGEELYTLLLVTCYSEDQEGLYNTMSSLAATAYSDQKKMLFVIADGIITGSGNPKPTPDIVLDMLEIDPAFEFPPMPLSYLAVADGSKRHNMACVYAAWFNYEGRRIPTILIVKTGTPRERNGPKPGNRGKRDSQMILMSFLNKITFDDPMVPLEYDLFQKMRHLMGVTPDNFEIVLMVDADTKVAPDSLARMVACMVDDPLVIGLCGETRIANKTESWVSRIQVFEYYLSHHLNKKFESVFGGVTCLPGCFCMYRIKCPKDGKWVPILCNPEIIDTYSETVVDTLHKKNLLLLGEDRFLTTLMLRTFPHRKMIFVPKAFCKTMVPANFRVLLSQRRRWINSTIHNLFELVLVRELCGIFCFSMQAVILLELIGTLTLPAAIIFTTVLIIMSFYQGITGGVAAVPWVPLALLFAILGLPAVLILLTSRRLVYIYWLVVYLLALPIWNFVLPVYAFWHFDDFSWGETRKVQGEGADGGHGESDGHFAGNVKMRRWCEWEYERRRLQRELYSEPREAIGAADGEIVAAPARTSSSRRI